MKKNGFLLILGLLVLVGCRDKELDMNLTQKTLFEGATINEIVAKDAWDVAVIRDENTYVELEYSAFLEEYLKVQQEGTVFSIGFKNHYGAHPNRP